jgi:hypothetical protein
MADNSVDPVVATGQPNPPASSRFLKRLVRYVIFLLVLLVLGMYLWKIFAVRSVETKLEVERSIMMEAQRQALDEQAKKMLRLAALPLAWAVRTEMMNNNLGQVDEYFRDLIRNPGVLLVALIGKEDKVVLATDRKLETQASDSLFSKNIRNADEIVIEDSESVLRLGVPIMGLNEKLGVLVMDFRRDSPQAPEMGN